MFGGKSSSSVVTPSGLHSYVKRRFSGPPFPPPSDSGNRLLAFYGSGMSFLLLASLVWYSILLPTLPLEREIGPTVVNICLDLTGGLILLLWTRWVVLGKLVGVGLWKFSGGGPKIF